MTENSTKEKIPHTLNRGRMVFQPSVPYKERPHEREFERV